MADGGVLLGIQREGHVVLTSGNSSTNSAPSPVGAGRYTKRPPCCCSTMRRASANPIPHPPDRKSTRLNSSHGYISYAVFCLKKKKNKYNNTEHQSSALNQ